MCLLSITIILLTFQLIQSHRRDLINYGTRSTGGASSRRVKAQKIACECGVAMDPSHLPRHMERVHENVRGHPCPRCNKLFFSPYDRNRHVARLHERSGSHPCHDCDKIFHHESNHNAHYSRIHTISQ